MANWLQNSGIPILMVATKADKISRGARQKCLNIIKKTLELDEDPLCFSAESGEGVDELSEAMEEIVI
jgi:GTP-binding protein